MFVSGECCVLSGRGLCVGLVTHPEEWCIYLECDHESSIMKRPWPTRGCCAEGGKNSKIDFVTVHRSMPSFH